MPNKPQGFLKLSQKRIISRHGMQKCVHTLLLMRSHAIIHMLLEELPVNIEIRSPVHFRMFKRISDLFQYNSRYKEGLDAPTLSLSHASCSSTAKVLADYWITL